MGMATNIPPHNLSEIVDALVMLIESPETTVSDLMRVVPGPDFPTYGYIYGVGGIRDAYTTGRGAITLRAKVHTEKLRGGREAIIVTELPYQVNKASLIEKIGELIREKKIDGDFRATGRIEPGGDPGGAGARAWRDPGNHPESALQTHPDADDLRCQHAGPRESAPSGGESPADAGEFLRFRREVVTRRTRYDLARAEERAHILEGLRKALDQIDLVIRLIRGAESVDAAREALMSRLALSEIQAKAILDMRLQRLTQLERHKIVEEHEQTLILITDASRGFWRQTPVDADHQGRGSGLEGGVRGRAANRDPDRDDRVDHRGSHR